MGRENIKKGKIFVVGIGPGNRNQMTYAAIEAINQSQVVTGYKTFLQLIEDLLEGKEVIKSVMKKEVARCKKTLEIAKEGKVVSLISSGDPGVYGMAGLMLEIKEEEKSDIEIEIVPGVTAANSAASSLGAPLMHDYTVISLSDLLTDWKIIEKRLHCAGEGDFVICLYNPKSNTRAEQIGLAKKILLKYKKETTPVGIVRKAKRGEEEITITTLSEMTEHKIDMLTIVIIGNSQTYTGQKFMITPRGYKFIDA